MRAQAPYLYKFDWFTGHTKLTTISKKRDIHSYGSGSICTFSQISHLSHVKEYWYKRHKDLTESKYFKYTMEPFRRPIMHFNHKGPTLVDKYKPNHNHHQDQHLHTGNQRDLRQNQEAHLGICPSRVYRKNIALHLTQT